MTFTRTEIPIDAKEVVYYPAFSRHSVPEVRKVTKHTATTVSIEGFDRPFRRRDGTERGTGYLGSRARIQPVTVEVLDELEAQKLQGLIKERENEAVDKCLKQHARRLELLREQFPHRASNVAQATRYAAALNTMLARYEGN